MRGAHRLLAGLLAAGALLTATGCAQSVDPIERLGRKAAQRVNPPPSRAAARPAGPRATAVRGDHGAPGALVVVSCGRSPRPGRDTRPPAREVRNGAGGRDVVPGEGPVPAGPGRGGVRNGRHEGRELALRLTEC
uniref:Lipoprotein n=1 Tax=Streptomyces sp. NBC_00008 TaxID=2903610 RepID=A0AAU2VPX4_9ACTN